MKNKNKMKLQVWLESGIGIWAFLLIIFLLPWKEAPVENIVVDNNQSSLDFVIHESAGEWEMFFAKNELNEILTWEDKKVIIDMLNEEFNEDKNNKSDREDKKTLNNSVTCDLPWPWYSIRHGESVLAYQQRSDVPSICKVERRVCYYGQLQWSYTQRSCKENPQYEYTKHKVILYNEKVVNSYIQPSKLAPNRNAEFSMQWKVNDPLTPNTTWNNNVNDALSTKPASNWLVDIVSKNCKTPWWDTVIHSQFTKAYKSSIGFIDKPCEVELRYCHDGDLEWSFVYKKCDFIDLIQEDYRFGKKEQEDKPTAMHLLESLGIK